MPVRMPWGTPTVSDATKLGTGLVHRSPIAPAAPAGALYQLLVQLVSSDDFPNLANWTVTDSGGNVNLAAGVVSMNGSGAWSANGIYEAAAHDHSDNEPSCFEIKAQNIKRNFLARIGAHNAGAWPGANGQRLGRLESTTVSGTSTFKAYSSYMSRIIDNLDDAIWYTVRLYHFPTLVEGGGLSYYGIMLLTLEGGATYPVETVVGVITGQDSWNAADVRMHIERYTNNGATLLQIKEFRYYHGLPTDGPTLTFVADAGAGKVIDNFDLTALAAVGGWATPNATFAWSFDDGVPAYSAEFSLANLNLQGKQLGRHRYARIRITVNSDGATQQYAGEINSDTATDGIGDFPEVNNTYLQDTVQLVAGTLRNPTEQMGILTYDILGNRKTSFLPTDIIYIRGTLEFMKAMLAAQVRVRVFTVAPAWVATPIDVPVNFAASVAQTLTAINGGVVVTAGPLPAGQYFLEFRTEHADLPGSIVEVYCGFDVVAPGGGGIANIRVIDPVDVALT